MASQQDNTNLFRVLERGDRKILKAHPNAIMMVGLTRSGKSTSFNWAIGKQMIGVGEQFQPHYENLVQTDIESAELGSSFTSVTLCPNIFELSKQEKISLLDMAGYFDKRNYIGVLGVSYFLKAVFEQVSRVKFIIVFDEGKLIEGSGDGIIKTFRGFINMFKMNEIVSNKQILNKFYSSISIVITKSQNYKKHQFYLRKILKMLQQPNFQEPNKNILIDLIDNIINSNRIQAFLMAETGKNPPKCTMIDKFNKMGWNYLDIKGINAELKQDLITLPFENDFIQLTDTQKNIFSQVIQKRIASYLQFSKILNILVNSVCQKWTACLEKWNQQQAFELNFKDYDSFFTTIAQFLSKNDFYVSQNLITPSKRSDFKHLNFIQTLKKVLQIYTIVDTIGDQSNTFMKNMESYSKNFEQLIDCLIPFCSTQSEQNLLIRLKFILKRGFRQFSKLYQIKPETIVKVNQEMKDNCNLIFQESKRQFIERFIKCINLDLSFKLFSNIQQLKQYEIFFNDYQTLYKDYQESTFFSQQRSNIEFSKARIYQKKGQKNAPLRCFVRALRYLGQIGGSISRSYKDQEQIQFELNMLLMKKLKTLHQITSLLREIQGIPQTKRYALTLCQYSNNIDEACQIFQEILDAEKKIDQKMKFIDQYVEYCIKWGRIQQANALLQKKLGLEKSNFENYMGTIERIYKLATDQERSKEEYMLSLKHWKRMPQQDQILLGYLDQLELIVPE